ncbi:MAG TPA: hypothetical protein VL401_04095 [Alphaproteobacteria bacterium]|jgi:hypothetical protein|nr:hypothetical protein [Alphaproteobacteria bacterium]
MKFLVKVILILIFVPFSLVFLLSSSVKFQLLNANFYKNIFVKNNVYANLSRDTKNYAENQTIKGGGKTEDLKVLTDIITPDLVKDIVTRNLDNFLDFTNGKKEKFLVYIPIHKLPKEFVPTSIDLQSEEIAFRNLISKFNFTLPADLPLSQIAYLGLFTNYVFFGSIFLVSIFIILLYRFRALSWGLIFSGVIVLVLSSLGFFLKTYFIFEIILHEVLIIWTIVGGVMLGLGIILSFVQRK